LQGCVVLAEDHPVNRKVISGLLKKFGLEVRGAANGGEALAQWRAGGVDLIVMDCHMPGMDGYAATALIRSEEKDGEHPGQHVPIIALTANASVGDALACIEAGMDGYATKPVMNSRLAWLLGRFLSPEGAAKTPVRLPLVDAAPAGGRPALAAIERFVRTAEAQTTILRDQLQAGQVAAAAASAGHMQRFSVEVGAALLAALFGEIQHMAGSGAFDDARAGLLELDGVLQATLNTLRGQTASVAA
jgi:CheY-like chemotaxis protein